MTTAKNIHTPNPMLNLHEITAAPNAIEQIIQALRSELEEYGAVLNLLDDQQAAILEGRRGAVCEIDQAIAAELETVSACESLVSTLMPAAGEKETPWPPPALFPQPMRPLVAALAGEIDHLLTRVCHRIQQNQSLWTRLMNDADDDDIRRLMLR